MLWFARLGGAALCLALALIGVLSYRADRSGYSLAQAALGLVSLAVAVRFTLRVRRLSRRRDGVAPPSLVK
ncbi:MAG: hypothetical protein U0232_17290 [Thermomicrobiales bacterium]